MYLREQESKRDRRILSRLDALGRVKEMQICALLTLENFHEILTRVVCFCIKKSCEEWAHVCYNVSRAFDISLEMYVSYVYPPLYLARYRSKGSLNAVQTSKRDREDRRDRTTTNRSGLCFPFSINNWSFACRLLDRIYVIKPALLYNARYTRVQSARLFRSSE